MEKPDLNSKENENNIKKAKEYYEKGVIDGQEGDFDRAIEWITKAVELNQEFIDAWYNLGNAYYMGKKDFENAYNCWQKALELKPDHIDVLYNLGDAYKELGRNDEAIECYKQLLKIEPKDHEAWNNLAVAYLQKKDIDQAIISWQKAVEIKPDKVESWYNLAATYYENLGNYQKAIECCEKALEIKPGAYILLRLLKEVKEGLKSQK